MIIGLYFLTMVVGIPIFFLMKEVRGRLHERVSKKAKWEIYADRTNRLIKLGMALMVLIELPLVLLILAAKVHDVFLH